MTIIKPQIWVRALIVSGAVLGMTTPVYPGSTKVDVCQKIGEILGPHLDANENVAFALTTMRVVGSADESARAAEVFDMVSENTLILVNGLEEIFSLCKDN